MYTGTKTRKRTAAHDIGILTHNKSALFGVCSVSRSIAFETLRRYDEDVEEWAHADAKWFRNGKVEEAGSLDGGC